MPEDDQVTRKATAQILGGWKSAGLDFLPPPRASEPSSLENALSESAGTTLAASNSESSPLGGSNVDHERVVFEMRQPAKATSNIVAVGESTPIWPDTRPQSSDDRSQQLETIRKEVVACTLCKELVACRTQTVFGVGSVRPRLCFFGEAPGADEDKQGEPFVGRAGQLLDKIIEAMTLRRSAVYILNTLKCRPPGNRTPLPDEVENCRPFFTRQLEILRPEFIVCLGACAAQALLRTKESIGKLRGRAHDYRGIKVYATYHPAYLLRNPPAKRDVWEDMKVVMKEMGLAIPKNKID